MAEAQSIPEAALELMGPDGTRRMVPVVCSPFQIGRGTESGNHLQLSDRRISRQCAAIIFENGEFRIEDRGQRSGLFVNSEKVSASALHPGDSIQFGLADSYQLVFHCGEESLPNLLTRMEQLSTTYEGGAGGLRKLNLLLEATALLHSQLPLDAILGTMVDHATEVTDADRGLLLIDTPGAGLKVRVARQRGGRMMPAEALEPSQTAIRMALEQKQSVVTEDVAQAGYDLQAAQSIIAQRLRSVVVIPLYARVGAGGEDAPEVRGPLLGVVYLDSRRPAAFSTLERQILDALAKEAASVLDNARLVERERDRQRMEQELSIAREIQQALLPREFGQFRHLKMTGINQSCLTVGGDYYDVLEVGDDRIAFLIADVSGKGLGAALLTTMLQGAVSSMSVGQEPARLFEHLNRFLCAHSQLERYATVFFALLDSAGRMEYINAGHPSPLLVRGEEVQAPFGAECLPVGLIPEAEYHSSFCQLQAGDTMILFSDGATEAMNPEDMEFGLVRLRETVNGCCHAQVEEIQRFILGAVEQFARGARQADDLTLLLVRYHGAAQAAAMAQ